MSSQIITQAHADALKSGPGQGFYPQSRGQARTAALENLIRSHVVMVERDEKLVGNNSAELTLKVAEKWM